MDHRFIMMIMILICVNHNNQKDQRYICAILQSRNFITLFQNFVTSHLSFIFIFEP